MVIIKLTLRSALLDSSIYKTKISADSYNNWVCPTNEEEKNTPETGTNVYSSSHDWWADYPFIFRRKSQKCRKEANTNIQIWRYKVRKWIWRHVKFLIFDEMSIVHRTEIISSSQSNIENSRECDFWGFLWRYKSHLFWRLSESQIHEE